jgi:hypothetical protein
VCEFVGLGVHHTVRMCRIVICDLPGPAVFSKLSHKRPGFRKKVTEHKNDFCSSLQLVSKKFLTLVHWSLGKVPVILVRY